MLIGALLVGAILVGSGLGVAVPGLADTAAGLTEPLILALVTLLLAGLRFDGVAALRRAPRAVAVALVLNFACIPLVAWAVSSALMFDEPALRIGVVLYCLFPCTDWFLGFTRLAGGDTVVGAALIPLNMALQLALFPLHLHLLVGTGPVTLGWDSWAGLVTWFAIPAAIAFAARAALRTTAGRHAEDTLRRGCDAMVPWVLAALVLSLFVGNVATMAEHPTAFLRVLLAVFLFLVVTYALGELAARWLALTYREHALVVMTTSARNAPLILALTVVALPDRPLIHAAIVLGMLVELPHLTALQYLLRRSEGRSRRSLHREAATAGSAS